MADAAVPRGFYKVGKYWYIYKVLRGVRIRRSTGKTTLDDAIAWWEAVKPTPARLLSSTTAIGSIRAALTIYNSAKNRAKKRGIQFSLTIDDVILLFARANGRCELTGIPFSDQRAGMERRAPFRPSLDRRFPARGYEPGNVRLVCVAVNTALADWGEPVFRAVAQAYLGHSLGHANMES